MRLLAALLVLLWFTAAAEAVNKYWVGGTGTWDATTTHWAATTGGAGGVAVPAAGEDVIFDANSGASAVVTIAVDINVASINGTAFTGTLDWSVNNKNVTITGGGLTSTGSLVRTINMGAGIWTFAGGSLIGSAPTNLTFVSSSAVLVISGGTATTRQFSLGAATSFASLQIGANGTGGCTNLNGSGSPVTFTTLTISAPNCILFPTGAGVITVTNAMTFTGASNAQFGFFSALVSGTGTLSSAAGATFTWSGFHNITFTGGGSFSATNSMNFGGTAGITISSFAPSGGGLPGGG